MPTRPLHSGLPSPMQPQRKLIPREVGHLAGWEVYDDASEGLLVVDSWVRRKGALADGSAVAPEACLAALSAPQRWGGTQAELTADCVSPRWYVNKWSHTSRDRPSPSRNRRLWQPAEQPAADSGRSDAEVQRVLELFSCGAAAGKGALRCTNVVRTQQEDAVTSRHEAGALTRGKRLSPALDAQAGAEGGSFSPEEPPKESPKPSCGADIASIPDVALTPSPKLQFHPASTQMARRSPPPQPPQLDSDSPQPQVPPRRTRPRSPFLSASVVGSTPAVLCRQGTLRASTSCSCLPPVVARTTQLTVELATGPRREKATQPRNGPHQEKRSSAVRHLSVSAPLAPIRDSVAVSVRGLKRLEAVIAAGAQRAQIADATSERARRVLSLQQTARRWRFLPTAADV